jgi:putative phosphotransacetylase
MDESLKEVPVEVSARHCHLSQADQDVLFGADYQMAIKKDLSQHGQFAAEEKITVKGPKGELSLRVLGPCRPVTQVELSKTECRALGIPAVLKESGHHEGSPGVKLIGPDGETMIESGAIVALRHIHISDKQAAERGLEKNQKVKVRVGGVRGVVFQEVIVRVHPTFDLRLHIDTDEGNACNAEMSGAVGELIVE